jgi:hypothetical protein
MMTLPVGAYGALVLSPFSLPPSTVRTASLAVWPCGRWANLSLGLDGSRADVPCVDPFAHNANLFGVKQGRHVTTIRNFQPDASALGTSMATAVDRNGRSESAPRRTSVGHSI